MKSTYKFSLLFLLVLAVSICGYAQSQKGYGISSWAGWKPGQISKVNCPELRSVPLILQWNSLELTPGKYEFDEKIGNPLKEAAKQGLSVTLMIWVGPSAPEWIYEKGVPLVITDRKVNALGQKTDGQKKYPYYLHPEYKKRFFGLINAFGSYVRALPPKLRQSIVFVQCAEGSTGDGEPYKGVPIEKKYEISNKVWNQFRLESWKQYQNAFPGIPILVNSDSNGNLESQWLLDNMEVIALKQGMFSHGYYVSDNDKRLAKLEGIETEAKKRGKRVLTRGEMDGELFEMGWSNRNIPQALYWSGIFASHCRLDIWNVPTQALLEKENLSACVFFNKYAGHKDPATSPSAFCALRDGLDASDFNRFPAETFGGKPENKKDPERYLNIAKAFAAYGARMDDPQKAVGGGMDNRKSKGVNDVGWGTLPNNYSRFLTQIAIGTGDAGYWNIDESIYGRFGRGFEHQSGKKQMRFRLDPTFNAKTVKVSITYLDRGKGTWSIGQSGQEKVTLVQNTDSGKWITKSIISSGFSELSLNYVSGDDTLFHLIEVDRIELPIR